MELTKRSVPRAALAITITVILWALHIYLREGLSLPPGDRTRLIVTTILVLSFAWAIFEQVQIFRNMDEYHRQVQFLALANAYPCGLVLTFAIGFFRAEGFLADLDPRDLPAALLLSGGLGYFIAWKRYS